MMCLAKNFSIFLLLLFVSIDNVIFGMEDWKQTPAGQEYQRLETEAAERLRIGFSGAEEEEQGWLGWFGSLFKGEDTTASTFNPHDHQSSYSYDHGQHSSGQWIPNNIYPARYVPVPHNHAFHHNPQPYAVPFNHAPPPQFHHVQHMPLSWIVTEDFDREQGWSNMMEKRSVDPFFKNVNKSDKVRHDPPAAIHKPVNIEADDRALAENIQKSLDLEESAVSASTNVEYERDVAQWTWDGNWVPPQRNRQERTEEVTVADLNSLAETIRVKADELKAAINAYGSRRSRKAKCEELKTFARQLLDKCRFGNTMICFRWWQTDFRNKVYSFRTNPLVKMPNYVQYFRPLSDIMDKCIEYGGKRSALREHVFPYLRMFIDRLPDVPKADDSPRTVTVKLFAKRILKKKGYTIFHGAVSVFHTVFTYTGPLGIHLYTEGEYSKFNEPSKRFEIHYTMELRPSAVQNVVDQLNNTRFGPGNYELIMNNCAIFARNLLKNLNKGVDLAPVFKRKSLTLPKEAVLEYARKYKRMLDGKKLTFIKMIQIWMAK